MRNWIGVGLAALVAGAVVGCGVGGGKQEPAPDGPTDATGKAVRVGIVFDSGGRGDKSFNDSAWAGAERAKSELGAEVSTVETKTEGDYEQNLTAMAERGNDLVIAVGLNQAKALETVAPKFPDVKFAIVDGTVEGPNVRMLKFNEEQGSFLVGFLAGLMSETGKIGFVGGMEIDLIKKFQYGYFAGATAANPRVQLLPAKFTGDWNNQDKAREAANVLFAGGADVVYAAAGRAGLGVITAARNAGKFAIGVDSDQDWIAEGTVLTSMIKRVDEAVFQTVKEVQDGRFQAGERVFGLEDGGVGTSEFKFTREKIGEERLKQLEAVRQEIIDGKIAVPTNQAEFDQFLAARASAPAQTK